jgi:hypothetical protein
MDSEYGVDRLACKSVAVLQHVLVVELFESVIHCVQDFQNHLLLKDCRRLGQVDFLVEIHSLAGFRVPDLVRDQSIKSRVDFNKAKQKAVDVQTVLAVHDKVNKPFFVLPLLFCNHLLNAYFGVLYFLLLAPLQLKPLSAF